MMYDSEGVEDDCIYSLVITTAVRDNIGHNVENEDSTSDSTDGSQSGR